MGPAPRHLSSLPFLPNPTPRVAALLGGGAGKGPHFLSSLSCFPNAIKDQERGRKGERERKGGREREGGRGRGGGRKGGGEREREKVCSQFLPGRF